MYYIYAPVTVLLSVWVFVKLERPARDWLRKNIRVLPMFLLDAVVIIGAALLSFNIMLGSSRDLKPYAGALSFVLRVGLPIFIFALILLRLYEPWPKRQLFLRLGLGVGAGSLIVAGLLYWAWTQAWVGMNGFPRVILALDAAILFVLLFVPRYLIRSRMVPALEKTA